MKRRLLALVAILVVGAGAAEARPIPDAGLTIEEMLAFTKSAGLDAKIAKGDQGAPYITTAKDGINFDIDLYDCKDGRCRAVQFVASFDLKEPLSAAKTNQWNLTKRYVRLYLDDAGDPIFAYDANLSPGGTYEALKDDLNIFLQFMPDMLERIGW